MRNWKKLGGRTKSFLIVNREIKFSIKMVTTTEPSPADALVQFINFKQMAEDIFNCKVYAIDCKVLLIFGGRGWGVTYAQTS